MCFVITNGTDFITKNQNRKYVKIRSEKEALKFPNKQIALNILNNQVNKNDRQNMFLREIIEPEDDLRQHTPASIPVNLPKVSHNLPESKFEIPQNVTSWIDKLKAMNGLTLEANIRKEALLIMLSDADKRISDLNHYIEGSNLNVCNGYKAYKAMKDLRLERRSIKNELEIVQYIINLNVSDTIGNDLEKVVSGISNKKYAPRALNELFVTE